MLLSLYAVHLSLYAVHLSLYAVQSLLHGLGASLVVWWWFAGPDLRARLASGDAMRAKTTRVGLAAKFRRCFG